LGERRLSMQAPQSGPQVLLRSEQTAAEVSVIESAAPPGFSGPPLHHHDFDETFYVIEGELTFELREELFRVVRERSPSRRAGCRTPSPTLAPAPPAI
jgi:quercetin dioxygenase-like cupin family protein